MKSFLTLIFGTTVLFATITQAERKESFSGLMKLNFTLAPNCEGRPEFITEVRPEIIGGFAKLPQLVLVANEAEYYVESKNSEAQLRIHSYHELPGNKCYRSCLKTRSRFSSPSSLPVK